MSAATERKDHDPRIGRIIHDRYRILRKIGEGGMGSVYEGEHLTIQRRIAIKCLHERISRDEKLVARFHREALAATKIGHPNIVDVLDFGAMEDGTSYMVLEYLEGRDFEDLIEEGRQPIGRTIRILMQVCDALRAAHARGIVHRDLKPENLFLVERDDNPHFVKVLDFGIAKFTEAEDFRLTQTGQAMGTPYYMAPEQLLGAPTVDARADLYSIGVILFHALTGEFPFEGQTFGQLVIRVSQSPPPPLTILREDAPEPLTQLVARLLSKDPAKRPASVSELREALLPFRGLDTIPPPRPPSTQARQESHAATMTPALTEPLGSMRNEDQMSLALTTPVTPKSLDIPAVTGEIGAAARLATATDVSTSLASGSVVMAPPTSSRLPIAIGATLALLAAVALLAWTVTPRDPSPEEETAAPVEMVRVTIATDPEDAELLLDGEAIVNPFSAELPRSEERHRLEARKEGYESAVRDLQLRFDGQHIQITLHRPGAEPPPAPVPAIAEPATEPETQPAERIRRNPRETPPAQAQVQTPPAQEPPRQAPPPTQEPPPAQEEEDLLRVRFGTKRTP